MSRGKSAGTVEREFFQSARPTSLIQRFARARVAVMGEVTELRKLVPGDEPRLFAFLERHVDTSLFFLSNVERAGLVDRGQPLQATYVAACDATGAITAVAGHAWNGNVMLQGHLGLEAAAERAVAASGRAVRELIGP